MPLQHVASTPVNIEPWQVINLVGGPLAAILLLPAVIDDLNHWWRQRAEARVNTEERRRPD